MPARPSVVCTECHRLKIGCNKALPSCDQCTFHHRICEYQRPTAPPIDNEILQERVSDIEQYYERERYKSLGPIQRTHDFDSPPSESAQPALPDTPLSTRRSDVFHILTKILSLPPQRPPSTQATRSVNRPPIPHSILPDHYYYIDRDGDPCVTPILLSLLPSLDEQPALLKILRDVLIFQPLGSHHELVCRIDTLRNTPSDLQETNGPSSLDLLGLYAIAAAAFALAAVGGPRPVMSSSRAINLYTAGRRALQLVINHPKSTPNSVNHLWSGISLLLFLLFSHRLTGREQPLSDAWHRKWIQAEIYVVLRMIVYACGDQEGNQLLQQPVSQDVHSRYLQERAKLASAAYYYEMHLSDLFDVPSLLPLDPPFFQTSFDANALFLATRTNLVKLIKAARHQLKAATSKCDQRLATEIMVSQSNAIKRFLTTMPASLTLDVEDVGQIRNVETAMQKIELVLEAWAGIIRLWRHLLAVEFDVATAPPSSPSLSPSDTQESPARPSPASPHSRDSPSAASNETFSRCAITRATRPCIDIITLLHVQFKILMGEPRYHFYLYSPAVPRRAFESGLVLARIITFCEEQDQETAVQALGALRRAMDLLELAASWFREQSGESVVEEAETLKLLRVLLAHTNNRVGLLDVSRAGSKRSHEAMEEMSDISAVRLEDLHGIRLPFTSDVLILDPVHPASRFPSLSQQMEVHHDRLAEPPVKSTLSSLAPSPSPTDLSNPIHANAVPEPPPSCFIKADPEASYKRVRLSPPIIIRRPHGEHKEVERKLRKIQPKGTVPPGASQTTGGMMMTMDQMLSGPLTVPDVHSKEHRQLQTSQQQPVNGAFTSSSDGPSRSGTPWMRPPWHGIPAPTPVRVPEAYAYVHLHGNSWAPPSIIAGSATAGMVLYAEEPYTSMGRSPVSISPVTSAPPHHPPVSGNLGVPCTYASYPPTISPTTVASEASPAHSYFSSYGPSPFPLHNEPTPESIPQPQPSPCAPVPPYPQHPQQPPWHYEAIHAPK